MYSHSPCIDLIIAALIIVYHIYTVFPSVLEGFLNMDVEKNYFVN
jgi:hypothetical protein